MHLLVYFFDYFPFCFPTPVFQHVASLGVNDCLKWNIDLCCPSTSKDSPVRMVCLRVSERVIKFNGLFRTSDIIFTWHRNHYLLSYRQHTNLQITINFEKGNNNANLRDLIAAPALVILFKLDSNRRFSSLCDIEV